LYIGLWNVILVIVYWALGFSPPVIVSCKPLSAPSKFEFIYFNLFIYNIRDALEKRKKKMFCDAFSKKLFG